MRHIKRVNWIKHIIFIVIAISIQSCSTVYYVGDTTVPTRIYSTQDTTSTLVFNVPVGTQVLIQKKYKKYHYVVYKNYSGYIYLTKYNNYHKFNSDNDGILYGYSTKKSKSKNSYSTSSSSSSSSTGGTVHVKGYYRKNGTYVKPHTRSAPKRH